MKTRIKNLLVAVLSLVMFATSMIGTDIHVKAAVNAVKITEDTEHIVKPGETSHIKLSIVATDIYLPKPGITISGEAGAPFTFSNITMKVGAAVVTDVYTGSPTDFEFDVNVKDNAKIGTYPITIKFNYYNYISQETETASITTDLKVNEEKAPTQLTVGNVALRDSNIGSKTDLSFTVKNEGEIAAKSVFITVNYGDPEIIEARYTATNIKIGDLGPGDTKDITLPITILSTASTGRKALTAAFTYNNPDDSSNDLSSTYKFYINLTAVTSETQTPKLNIEDITYDKGLKPGDSFNLYVNLKNAGGAAAKNVVVKVDDSSIGKDIIKNYFSEGVLIDNMAKNAEAKVEIPLSVSKYSTGGLFEVKVLVTYTDETGTAYTANDMVYVDVVAAVADSGSPNLIIGNVSQNPAQPVAGDKVEISFDLENKSNVDVSDLKVAATGLSETTFIPVNSDPYQYYDLLKGGDKIRVTIPLIVSEFIAEGLNNITISYSFAGNEGGTSIILPVKNVKNETVSISKPKLIVSKYSTDVEKLTAGSTFNFTFDLYNTNSSVAAKNITVTISQPENIFTVTQGSNSFFINKIDPGETITNTLEMKVKSDASTKAYTVEILIEYEYDGAKPNPTTGEIGESRTEKLNLQAIENSRPVVNNVNVMNWDGTPAMFGNPSTLNMEFYNMGRSPLNNVSVTVEGDFTKSDGNMYFIGNVPEGTSTYAQFDVIPNIEGTANGVLRITFEDSNGDTKEITKEFKAEVMPAGNGGGMTPGGPVNDGSGDVFNPGGAVTAKKEIVPIWLFVIIQCAIFILFIPITRKIIISAYKAKMRRKEQDQF